LTFIDLCWRLSFDSVGYRRYTLHMPFQRDSQGPDHFPTVNVSMAIEGVITQTSPYVTYLKDNLLTEIYRPEWNGVFKTNEPIEHLYTVKAPSGGTREEWYYHEHSIDRYKMLEGLLDIGLYDGRENSKTYKKFIVISLGESGKGFPDMLRIPPMVWHSLKWVSKSGLLMNAKFPGYQKNIPDKFRIHMNEIPEEIKWNT
jgi:dTDP-4-dehydrorhamnose 3,5-epimerase-like enzyme